MLALGTLVKGSVALLLGVAVVFVWLASERRLAEIRRMPLRWCAVVYGAIVVPWFVLMELRNPGFLRFFFIHEHLERYVSSTEHGWGPWFFIPIVVGGTWPWIFFAPLGWSAMRTDADGSESGPAPSVPDQCRAAANFLAIWFVLIFVFFSIPRSKLGTYILPALPPLAIFAGCGLSRLSALATTSRRRLLAGFAIANVIFGLAGIVFFETMIGPINASLALDGFLLGLAILGVGVLMYALGRNPMWLPEAIAPSPLWMLAMAPLSNYAPHPSTSPPPS